jgi:DICT domain-containing protein
MLGEFVDEIAADSRTVTVFASDPDRMLERYFETRSVTVEHEPLPDDGTEGFVVVTADDEFVGSLDRATVRELVSPTDSDRERAPNETVRLPMNLLADTTFVSFHERQLLVATREIEDRAYRQGRGTLRSGFQSLSRVEAERETYESLTANTDLDVHVYGRPKSPDARPNATDERLQLKSATVHAEETDEIDAFWFIVFDGGGNDSQTCALVAEEVDTERRSFRGFWTYDAEPVGEIDAYLRETYDRDG